MAVNCPACGLVSQDAEFCDHCNADLAPPALVHVPHYCPLFPPGVALTAEQRSALVRPESYFLLTRPDGHYRVHWLPRDELPYWSPMLEERGRFRLDVLPSYSWHEDAEGRWIASHTTGLRAEPWRIPQADNPLDELQRLFRFVEVLTRAFAELHAHNLVWLNFDPAEIEVVQAADPSSMPLFRITNLDLEVYPAGYCPERLNLKLAFAAPEICRGYADDIGPPTDVFHLAVFCYYWLARRLPGGLPGAGLESFGFQLPPLRTFIPDLPPGVIGVLQRGLATDPFQRWPTPQAFAWALKDALDRIDARWTCAEPIRWEIGGHTRVGRAKAALHGNNEDGVLIKEFADPGRALLAVADGITTCDVGSGALASSLALDVLSSLFSEHCRRDDYPAMITFASDQAARSLLEWAIHNGHEATLRDGRDLMGTTLVAGWLEDRHFSLANIGDSRAYLLWEKSIEQLTVDGDLGSGLLAAGTPPEQVRDLGAVGRALRECIGGCHVSAEGKLEPLPDCFPTLSNCPLLPGDVIVLCSDGLVEEGVFLDPGTVLEIVRHHRELSAQALATLLVDRADAFQRLPSTLEPEGFGDNISCVVIKITAAT